MKRKCERKRKQKKRNKKHVGNINLRYFRTKPRPIKATAVEIEINAAIK